MTQVKICGINDPAAFDAAVQAGADWVGFVFFPPSPRYVTPEAAAALSSRIDGGPPRVGLFVEPDIDAIARVLDTVRLDVLQIYGALDSLPAIGARFGLPVWHAAGIASAADLPSDSRGADRLLLEATPPVGANRPGGNGVSFDWSLMRGWKAPVPWMLAGGLTPANVSTAIRQSAADSVDVSSGVEVRKGVKDPGAIKRFIEAAKASARD